MVINGKCRRTKWNIFEILFCFKYKKFIIFKPSHLGFESIFLFVNYTAYPMIKFNNSTGHNELQIQVIIQRMFCIFCFLKLLALSDIFSQWKPWNQLILFSNYLPHGDLLNMNAFHAFTECTSLPHSSWNVTFGTHHFTCINFSHHNVPQTFFIHLLILALTTCILTKSNNTANS
jgi:hypothetical protein